MNLKLVYLTTAILTLIIFFSGIYVTYSIYNPQHIETEIKNIKEEMKGIEDEFILFTLNDKENCPVLSAFFIESNSRLNNIGNRLKLLANTEKSREFDDLKDEFISLSIKSWLMSKQIKKNCDEEIIPVMYFYSYPCEECDRQESVLEELKDLYSHKILVYSVDVTNEKPFSRLLVSSYGIDKTPSLLINSSIYKGFQGKEELNKIFSNSIKTA